VSAPILYLGLEVHKDSVTVAVFAAGEREPRLLEKLPHDLRCIRRPLQRQKQERRADPNLLRSERRWLCAPAAAHGLGQLTARRSAGGARAAYGRLKTAPWGMPLALLP
jgi:hypothetical protein